MFARYRFMILMSALFLVMGACGDDAGGGTGSNDTPDGAVQSGSATGIGGGESTDGSRSERDTSPLPDTAQPDAVSPGPATLPAPPRRVEFAADDGKALVGYFFPGATNPAPTVVLMHWAGGDQRDWVAIAPWLQNRRTELPGGWQDAIGADCGPQREGPWLDLTWFPVMPVGSSFAVFTFDFRDFCESDPGMEHPSEWALDAKAAFDAAAGLDGVDRTRMVAIGASIGADGAVDGCVLHNRAASTCLGGFSLSPGDYLIGEHYPMSYVETVTQLDQAEPPIPTWCLAAEGDTTSSERCRSASGREYRAQIYPGGEHGMALITPTLEPNPLVLIQEFLERAFPLTG